jgi:hypothetical protein
MRELQGEGAVATGLYDINPASFCASKPANSSMKEIAIPTTDKEGDILMAREEKFPKREVTNVLGAPSSSLELAESQRTLLCIPPEVR